MEKIIIDGVDVAGCGYFCEADNECSICGMGIDGEDTFCRYCKDNSNCYYKQLKRLEQENERLKALLDVLEEDNKKLSKENDVFYNNSLQEVKEDLIQKVWNLQKQYAEIVSKFEIESLTDNTTGETFYRSMKLYKYKQTLQEIKAIAESAMAKQQEYKKDFEQILDLITKAEEE